MNIYYLNKNIFSEYLATKKALGFLDTVDNTAIDFKRFKAGYTLFVFDLSRYVSLYIDVRIYLSQYFFALQ